MTSTNTKAAPITRKYHVVHRDKSGAVTSERIIEATNRANARAHASNTTISVDLLDVDNAMRLSGEGVKPEVAGEVADPDAGVDPAQPNLPGVTVADPGATTKLAHGEFETH